MKTSFKSPFDSDQCREQDHRPTLKKQTKSFFKECKNNHVKMAETPLLFLFAYYSNMMMFCEQIQSCSYYTKMTITILSLLGTEFLPQDKTTYTHNLVQVCNQRREEWKWPHCMDINSSITWMTAFKKKKKEKQIGVECDL